MQKKFTLFALSLGICLLSSGQMRYGVKLGVTQSIVEESFDRNQEMNFKTGIQIGVMTEISLKKKLDLKTALQLTQKGYKAVEGNIDGRYYRDRNWSTSYLEIPVNIIYNISISKDFKIFIGTGPVFGIGLFGKGKYVFKATDGAGQLLTFEDSDSQPFKRADYQRIDIGADILTGLQFKSILMTVNYNHGLLNVLNYDTGIQTTKNRSFAFTIGYLFGNG